MKIITAGAKYIDIDAFACMVAYAELLNLRGDSALAVSMAPYNYSVPKSLQLLSTSVSRTYEPNSDDEYILVDISDPKYFEKFVNTSRIIQVIDHHRGFGAYWEELLGSGSHIEWVGAAATILYEFWEEAGLLDKISQATTRLLIAAILDNTLDFQAEISSKRDKAAYMSLRKKAKLPKDWTKRYFEECQQAIENNLAEALQNDSKTIGLLGNDYFVAQMAVWNGVSFAPDNAWRLIDILEGHSESGFINVISIAENKSYFICSNPTTRKVLSGLLEVQFDKDIAVADRLWLRKEMVNHSLKIEKKEKYSK